MLLWFLLRLPRILIARALGRLGVTLMAEPPVAAPPAPGAPPFAGPLDDEVPFADLRGDAAPAADRPGFADAEPEPEPEPEEPPFADPRADDALPGEDSPNGPPPPSAAEALARSADREEAAPVPEPALSPEDQPAHVDREAVVVESSGPAADPHALFQVDEPWEGYAAMPAPAIVARLRDADEATKAVARLYEANHKNRATVLRATE